MCILGYQHRASLSFCMQSANVSLAHCRLNFPSLTASPPSTSLNSASGASSRTTQRGIGSLPRHVPLYRCRARRCIKNASIIGSPHSACVSIGNTTTSSSATADGRGSGWNADQDIVLQEREPHKRSHLCIVEQISNTHSPARYCCRRLKSIHSALHFTLTEFEIIRLHSG